MDWFWNRWASPKKPRNSETAATRLTTWPIRIVVTPTDSMRLLTWSAGNDSEKMSETTFWIVRIAKAMIIRVQDLNEPVIRVILYA